jgi:hypothetical protein
MAKNIIAFLDHEPPHDSRNLRKSFVNRERELAQVVDSVKAVKKTDRGRILAVTGLARVGKSHLLRRAMLDVKRSFGAVIYVRIVPGHRDGRDVLREMLHQVTAQLDTAVAQKGVSDGDRSVLEPLYDIRRRYAEAIAGSAKVQVNEMEIKGLQTRLSASIKSPVAAVLGGLQGDLASTRQQSETESRVVEIQPFDEQMLCSLVSMGHQLVRAAQPRWHTLLVIDDFDILQRSEDGSFDPVPLMQQLSSLAQVEGLHVLTTAREDTFYGHPNSFYQLAHVSPFDHNQHLIEAYRLRVELYNAGEDPLSAEVVADIARRTEGRIGVFFRWLRNFHEASETDLSTWFWSVWRSYEKAKHEAAECILNAALRGGEGRLSTEEADKVRGTSLLRFALEDYTTYGSLRVEPLTLSFLREQSP